MTRGLESAQIRRTLELNLLPADVNIDLLEHDDDDCPTPFRTTEDYQLGRAPYMMTTHIYEYNSDKTLKRVFKVPYF